MYEKVCNMGHSGIFIILGRGHWAYVVRSQTLTFRVWTLFNHSNGLQTFSLISPQLHFDPLANPSPFEANFELRVCVLVFLKEEGRRGDEPRSVRAPWIQNLITFGHSLNVKSYKLDETMPRSSLAMKFVFFWSH